MLFFSLFHLSIYIYLCDGTIVLCTSFSWRVCSSWPLYVHKIYMWPNRWILEGFVRLAVAFLKNAWYLHVTKPMTRCWETSRSLSVPHTVLFCLGNLFIDEGRQCIPSITFTYTTIAHKRWWILLAVTSICGVGTQTGMEARSIIVTTAGVWYCAMT